MNGTQTYTKAIGMFDFGRRLHVLYGHDSPTGYKWSPLCCMDSDDGNKARPLYFTPDAERVTCRRCQAEMGRIRRGKLG